MNLTRQRILSRKLFRLHTLRYERRLLLVLFEEKSINVTNLPLLQIMSQICFFYKMQYITVAVAAILFLL